MIPLAGPNFCGNELEYVKDCLDTGWVSYAGQYVEKLEQSICDYTESSYAVACVSGTAAIELALRVSGVEPGDEVLVPSLTFVATINAIKHVGAEPVFMDCDHTLNMDMKKTIQFLKEECHYAPSAGYMNKKSHKFVKAILPVHILGGLADVATFHKEIEPCQIKVIVDSAEALGSWNKMDYDLYRWSAGAEGDIGIFSFSFNKIITAGGGGILVTHDEELAKKAKYLALQAKDDAENYIHNEVGFNLGMTNINAAIAVAQMEQLEYFLILKQDIFLQYEKGLRDVKGIRLFDFRTKNVEPNNWFNAIFVDREEFGMSALGLRDKLKENNIEARLLWRPNHLQKAFNNCQSYKIDNTLHYWQNTLCLPCGTTLSAEDQQKVIEAITEAS